MSDRIYILEQNVHVKQVRDHWELYVDGDFFCSGDTYLEAVNEYYNQCC